LLSGNAQTPALPRQLRVAIDATFGCALLLLVNSITVLQPASFSLHKLAGWLVGPLLQLHTAQPLQMAVPSNYCAAAIPAQAAASLLLHLLLLLLHYQRPPLPAAAAAAAA
jgi:hypothetical protein